MAEVKEEQLYLPEQVLYLPDVPVKTLYSEKHKVRLYIREVSTMKRLFI
jgi:hypothetical protein